MTILHTDDNQPHSSHEGAAEQGHLQVEFHTPEPAPGESGGLPPAENPESTPAPQPGANDRVTPPASESEQQQRTQHAAPSAMRTTHPIRHRALPDVSYPGTVRYEAQQITADLMKVERFFAGYMDQLFHEHDSHKNYREETRLHAVGLVRAIRESTIAQNQMHSSHGAQPADPFFEQPRIPYLELQLLGDRSESVTQTIPLGEYAERLRAHYPGVNLSPLLARVNSQLICVGVDPKASHTHYLYMPDCAGLLEAFENHTLSFSEAGY